MRYNYAFFLILFLGQYIVSMQQVALSAEIVERFTIGAQKNWPQATKDILNDKTSSTRTAQVFNRYTHLFVEHAKQKYQPGKPIEQIIEEVRSSYPTQSELRTIHNKKMSWGEWFYSWVPGIKDPVCAQEWNQHLWMLETSLLNEHHQLKNPDEFLRTNMESDVRDQIPQ